MDLKRWKDFTLERRGMPGRKKSMIEDKEYESIQACSSKKE